jgi:hypothetical protein
MAGFDPCRFNGLSMRVAPDFEIAYIKLMIAAALTSSHA